MPSAVSSAFAPNIASARVRVGVLRPVGQHAPMGRSTSGDFRSGSGVRRHGPSGALRSLRGAAQRRQGGCKGGAQGSEETAPNFVM